MRDTTFTKRIIGESPEIARPWRNGFTADNAGGSAPICLSLRSNDGRHMGGPSMSLFKWYDWIDDGGPVEKLLIEFSVGSVYVEGFHMKRQVEALFEEGKLKRIQAHDSGEIEAIRAHNLDIKEPEKKEPVVLRIVIAPDLKTRLKTDENLAAIAAAMKGENTVETGSAG